MFLRDPDDGCRCIFFTSANRQMKRGWAFLVHACLPTEIFLQENNSMRLDHSAANQEQIRPPDPKPAQKMPGSRRIQEGFGAWALAFGVLA